MSGPVQAWTFIVGTASLECQVAKVEADWAAHTPSSTVYTTATPSRTGLSCAMLPRSNRQRASEVTTDGSNALFELRTIRIDELSTDPSRRIANSTSTRPPTPAERSTRGYVGVASGAIDSNRRRSTQPRALRGASAGHGRGAGGPLGTEACEQPATANKAPNANARVYRMDPSSAVAGWRDGRMTITARPAGGISLAEPGAPRTRSSGTSAPPRRAPRRAAAT